MTTEIEKLYENAGIEPIKQGYCDWDSDCPYPDIINSGCGDECPYWKYEDEAKYPPFTAEKQLEIVKLILFSTWWLNLKRLQFDENFENSLAELVNDIWQILTEEEKQQIRGILE